MDLHDLNWILISLMRCFRFYLEASLDGSLLVFDQKIFDYSDVD